MSNFRNRLAIVLQGLNIDTINLDYKITEKQEYNYVTLVFVITCNDVIIYQRSYRVTEHQYLQVREEIHNVFEQSVMEDLLIYAIQKLIEIGKSNITSDTNLKINDSDE